MLGLATIGQAPREDVVASMFTDIDSGAIIQAGALDGFDSSTINGLGPKDGEQPLVTRLNDGTEVVISKERVTPLLSDAIQLLEAHGATLICVLCTGQFQGLSSTRRIVYPDSVLAGVIDALLPVGKLGVLIPHAGQNVSMRQKWARDARGVELRVASPYDLSSSFEDAARGLEHAGADMIVLDCMGYTRQMQARARSSVNVPVLLANELVGSVLGSMIPLSTSGR